MRRWLRQCILCRNIICGGLTLAVMAGLLKLIRSSFAASLPLGFFVCAVIVGASFLTAYILDKSAGRY